MTTLRRLDRCSATNTSKTAMAERSVVPVSNTDSYSGLLGWLLCRLGRHKDAAQTRAVRNGWDDLDRPGVDNDVAVACVRCGKVADE